MVHTGAGAETMSWLRLTVECPMQQVAALSQLFEQFDALAISSEAVSEEPLYAGVDEAPIYWQRTAISALFDPGIDLDILLACARNRIGDDHLLGSRVEAVSDKNWIDEQQKEFSAMVFADRLCIHPSWVAAPQDCAATLVLDPGLAFGSGRHATTSLCLNWLAGRDLEHCELIDYGCGSGILALAAAALGAASVSAVDIDPQALSACRANADRNHLLDRVSVHSAGESALPTADILIANILLKPLQELAPRFAALLRPGGKLVLSGILAVQVDACLATYRPWFNMDAPVFQDEWALLEGTRVAASQPGKE